MKTADEILQLPYARILIPEPEGGFTAQILEFHGCFAEGETAQEAFDNLESAAKTWVDETLAVGQEVPPPADTDAFSGRVALRLPRSLHQRAVRLAERDRTSLNQFLVASIAARVGADDLYQRMADRMMQSFRVLALTLLGTATTGSTPTLQAARLALPAAEIAHATTSPGHLYAPGPDTLSGGGHA